MPVSSVRLLPMTQTFHVDLRGMVDLLSRHLYSSSRVYLRELVQNATDAITARRNVDLDHQGVITITPADVSDDGRLYVHDNGIGLDNDAIRTVLATIGGSTKRDDLGFARDEFLGQFGIGLLSCFLVSDTIEVRTRKVGTDETWLWQGRSDGTYSVQPADKQLESPGTVVGLTPSSDADELVNTRTVRQLVTAVAAYLPVDIVLHTADGDEHPCGRVFPWDHHDSSEQQLTVNNMTLCRERLGFEPLDAFALKDPETGICGTAFVLPHAGPRTAKHSVYAKHMLVNEHVEGLLPNWAFFVSAVINADHLSLTASREALHDDETLAAARDRLGQQILQWIHHTAASNPQMAHRFFQVHHLAAKAAAVEHPEMLELVGDLLMWETSYGAMTLSEIATEALSNYGGVITYHTADNEYRAVAQLYRSQNQFVINAGFAYDVDILTHWLATHPQIDARRAQAHDVLAHIDELTEADQKRFEAVQHRASQSLSRAGCDVAVRRFEPAHTAAMLINDALGRVEQDRQDLLSNADGAWGEVLSALEPVKSSGPVFVLNANSRVVQHLADRPNQEVSQEVIEVLYAQSLLVGNHPLRPFDAELVTRALPKLIDRVMEV